MNANERELKPTAEAEAIFRRWIGHLNEEFTRSAAPERRAEVVRDELFQIYMGRPHGGKISSTLSSELAVSVISVNFDPLNVTLESEYLEGVDAEKFAARKPLIWFWRMFDRSPLGLNYWLGMRVRCMLAHHIFASVGKGVKLGSGIEFPFGYNIDVEDNCRIGRGAVLDDRSPLRIPAGTVVAPGQRFGAEETKA
jgi:hypothetical protein